MRKNFNLQSPRTLFIFKSISWGVGTSKNMTNSIVVNVNSHIDLVIMFFLRTYDVHNKF